MGCHDLDFTIHNADFCHEKAQKAQNVIEDAPWAEDNSVHFVLFCGGFKALFASGRARVLLCLSDQDRNYRFRRSRM